MAQAECSYPTIRKNSPGSRKTSSSRESPTESRSGMRRGRMHTKPKSRKMPSEWQKLLGLLAPSNPYLATSDCWRISILSCAHDDLGSPAIRCYQGPPLPRLRRVNIEVFFYMKR